MPESLAPLAVEAPPGSYNLMMRQSFNFGGIVGRLMIVLHVEVIRSGG